jgi:hypothetical protein
MSLNLFIPHEGSFGPYIFLKLLVIGRSWISDTRNLS